MEIEVLESHIDSTYFVDGISVAESHSDEVSIICCCVPGCSTSSSADYSFYTLQGIERLRLRKWKQLLGLDKIRKTDKVCGKHFSDDQFSSKCIAAQRTQKSALIELLFF
jgi:THAP domain